MSLKVGILTVTATSAGSELQPSEVPTTVTVLLPADSVLTLWVALPVCPFQV